MQKCGYLSKKGFIFIQAAILIVFSMGGLAGADSEPIQISSDNTMEEIIHKAVRVRPAPRQLAWQELEFITFIHFGVNTFRGVEWGNGMEDPAIFNPTELDAEQWVKTAKAAGMKLMMLTVKHHDGFCLWQTRYTDHSVASSPWRNGRGDVFRELTEACAKHGMKVGVYLSPADLYQIENSKGLYGNLSKYSERTIPRPVAGRPFKDKRTFQYKVDDYNEYFMNQLFELLTEYGPIHEVWFDGAHPKRKGGQTYTSDQWYEMIRKLAPDAVIAIAGPDVRWCGNEGGGTRESEWSVVPTNYRNSDPDIGSRQKIAKAPGLKWYPAETNTSIRRGWFWRDERQYVREVDNVLDIWYRAVGGNSVFLLNVTPDRRGLIPNRDVKVLREVGEILRKTFAVNLAEGADAKASFTRDGGNFKAAHILDGDTLTCWMAPDGQEKVELIVRLSGKKTFNRVVIQEQIKDFSQRIEKFAVDAWVEGNWQEIARGTTVGYKRICRTDNIATDKVRLRILGARVCPAISSFSLHREPVRLSVPVITRNRSGLVTIACKTPGPVIRYTLDGDEPTVRSSRYKKPFELPRGGIVKARAFIEETGDQSAITQAEFDICSAKWKVVYVDSEQKSDEEAAVNAIDGDPDTIWHTNWRETNKPHPHEIQIDLGETLKLRGFTYLPRKNNTNGTILEYEFYVSSDGKNWGLPQSRGKFSNIINNPVRQTVRFDKVVTGRYIKLIALSEVTGKPWTSMAELGVLTAQP